ncbi:hypothetical protein Droror1_Dr00016358 [Drosera rotundifolia]
MTWPSLRLRNALLLLKSSWSFAWVCLPKDGWAGISLDSNIQDDNDEMVEEENATSTTVDVVNQGGASVAPNGAGMGMIFVSKWVFKWGRAGPINNQVGDGVGSINNPPRCHLSRLMKQSPFLHLQQGSKA